MANFLSNARDYVRGKFGLAATDTKQLDTDQGVTRGLAGDLRSAIPGVNDQRTVNQIQGSPVIASQAAAGQAGVHTAQDPGFVTHSTVDGAADVHTDPARIVGAGPASLAQHAGQAYALGADASRIDTRQSNDVRGQELGLAEDLRGTISGQGPSVAREQLTQGLQGINDAAAASAANARGSDRAAARRGALYASASGMGRAAQDASLLRAHEVATARGQLGGLLGQTRGVDASLATQQAGMNTDVSKTNAGLGTSVSLGNMGETGTTNRFNAGQTNSVNTFNAGEMNRGALANRGMTSAEGMSNQGQTNAIRTGNANRGVQVDQFNVGQAADMNRFNAAAGNQVDMFNTGEANTTNRFNTGQTNQAGQFNSTQDVGIQGQNIDNTLQGRGMDDNRYGNAVDAALGANSQIVGGDLNRIGIKQGDQQRRSSFLGGALNTAGSVYTRGAK